MTALEAEAQAIEVLELRSGGESGYDIVLDYGIARAGGGAARKSIACGFAGSGFEAGRLELKAVRMEPGGALSEMQLFWLRRWLAMSPDLPIRGADRTSPTSGNGWSRTAFALQLLVNATVLGCLYGLLALGFTLIHRLIGQINLAFGQIYMVGAMAAALVAILAGALGLGAVPAGLAAALVAAASTAAAHSYVSERVVFRRLRGSSVHVPLIAAIGLALFLQEHVRLLQGARNLWLDSLSSAPLTVVADGAFPVTASPMQLTVVGLTLAIYGLLLFLMGRSGFGRRYRACAGDMQMAALLGIHTERITATTFVLSGLLAGIAGFLVVTYYGVANFFMGFAMGFKALVAAILGGIGSLPGAMLGGLLLALAETAWAGWLDPAWRDVAVFGLLAMILIWKPGGLIGLDRR